MIIDSREVPGAPAFQSLMRFAALLPGSSQVTLRTPDGSVDLPGASGLSPDHEPEVSVILCGAVVRYAEESVDMAALAEGVTLP